MNKYELSEAYIGGPTGTVHGRFRTYGSGGGSSGGTSTTTQEIPAELKPLATAYTNKAMDLSNQPFNPYTEQRYADLNQTQNLGLDMVQDRALGGSQTMDNAEGSLNQFIQGGQTNPYLDSMYDAGAQGMIRNFDNSVLPGVNSTFAQGGRYGSEAHQTALDNASNTLGTNLGNMATNMYGNAYNTDQANRMQAIGMAPTFGNAAYQDASQLMNAGQIQQDQSQNNLDFSYQQYQDEENNPYKQLAAMGGVFGSNLGASSTTQSSGGGK